MLRNIWIANLSAEYYYRWPSWTTKWGWSVDQLNSSPLQHFNISLLLSHWTNVLNPDTSVSLAVMASWLAYHAWRSLWRVFDSIRRNFATLFLFDSSKLHRLISNSKPELSSTPSPVCLSVTCLGSSYTDKFEVIQLPRLYPIFPADGSKGDTTIEYVPCFESKK